MDEKTERIKTERMLCKCPRGHKLRGDVALIGKSVRCPRCNDKFVFGYQVRESISDTAVVRILGDAPALQQGSSPDHRSTCSECGTELSGAANLCRPCSNSLGVLPDFFSQLCGGSDSGVN